MSDPYAYADTQDAYDTYRKYLALKQHFTVDSYDYFKFKGVVRASPESYRKRRDKVYFYYLSKQGDVERRILSHMLKDPDVWIKGIVDDEVTYKEWLKKHEAFTHFFKNEIKKIGDLKSAVKVDGGDYPVLLEMHISGDVSVETIVGLDVATGLMDYWKRNLTDTLFFPSLYKKVMKYKPFLSLNKQNLLTAITHK